MTHAWQGSQCRQWRYSWRQWDWRGNDDVELFFLRNLDSTSHNTGCDSNEDDSDDYHGSSDVEDYNYYS